MNDLSFVNLFWAVWRTLVTNAERLGLDPGDIPLHNLLNGITKYLKGITPKPVNDGSTSRVKVEKGKARVQTEPPPSDAEPKQVIVPPPELTSLIKSIIDCYSVPSVQAVQEVASDESAAKSQSTAMAPMSIANERTLWSRAFKGLSENARKTATNLYVSYSHDESLVNSLQASCR